MPGDAVQDNGAQQAGRRECKKVIVLGPMAQADHVDPMIADIETQLIRAGIGVVSAAVTGRTVTGEGAAPPKELSILEKTLVRAEATKADCVVQVHHMAMTGVPPQYFVWSYDRKAMVAQGRAVYDRTYAGHRWLVEGEGGIHVRAKVLDVKTADVLAVIDLQHRLGAPPVTISVVSPLPGDQGERRTYLPWNGSDMITRLVHQILGVPSHEQ